MLKYKIDLYKGLHTGYPFIYISGESKKKTQGKHVEKM